VGAVENKFIGNFVNIFGPAPKWHIYCGVHSSNNEFINNTLRGPASKAYISVETAFDNTVTTPASYGYGESASVNNFANTGMSNVTVSGNTIYPTSAVPAIFLSQITDGGGAYQLTNCTITGNMVSNNTPSKQLEIFEETANSLYYMTLDNNKFYPLAAENTFTFPRGRLHFISCLGNSVVDTNTVFIAPNIAIPSIAVGSFFTHQDTVATNVTGYSGGAEGTEIIVRLTIFTTLVHNNAAMRLKGSVNVVGPGSNAILSLRYMSGIWIEIWRNF